VLLKIIKHCTENTSELVMGQLLGMDVDNTLEISHAFPFPTDGDDEREDNAYQIEMLRALRSQNEDANFVGLYHAAFLSETLYSMDLIQAQYAYQLDVPNSVCIMFDPFKSQKGRLSIKAIRLTQNFMQLYAAGKFVPKAMQKHAIDSKGIFDEIPLRVSNSHLVHGFIYGLRETRRFDCTAARLGLGAAPLLDKMVDLVSGPYGCIDDFVTEQDRYKQQQVLANRQKAELQRRIENNADENARRQNLGLPPVFTVRTPTRLCFVSSILGVFFPLFFFVMISFYGQTTHGGYQKAF
jgi:translation initiation factor 3 subunit H